MPLIKYVGKKEIQKDVLHGSFTVWNGNGDIKHVPADIEAKLLQHPDCYEQATEDELVTLLEQRAAAIETLYPKVEDKAEDIGTRIEQIAAVIDMLDPKDEELWGKSNGKPHVQTIELRLGFDIKAAERDAALDLIDARETE